MLKAYISIILIVLFACELPAQETKTNNVNPNEQLIDSLVKDVSKHFFAKNYDQTIELGEHLIKLSEKHNYYKKYNKTKSFIGNAHMELADTIQAKKTFEESILMAEKINDTLGILISKIDFANFYALQNDPKAKIAAIELYKNVLPLAEKFNSQNKLIILNSNIAELYIDLNDIKNAKIFVFKTDKAITDSTFVGFKGGALLNKARLNYLAGFPRISLDDLNKGEKYFKEINYIDGIIDIYFHKAKANNRLEDYRAAFDNMQVLDSLKAEKYRIDKINAVETVVAKFKLEEIEQKIEAEILIGELNKKEAKKETTYLWVKIVSGILLLSSIILFYLNLRRKKLLANLIIKNKQYVEEKEKSEKLAQAKSLLFSNITHELRTPMYGIIGISNILLKDNSSTINNKHLKSLRFSADYLMTLINNILHFNQMEKSTVASKTEAQFEIRGLIDNVVATSKFLNENQPNTYKVAIDEKVPAILIGDRSRLSQILMNLVGNASKFTKNGIIAITLKLIESNIDSIKIAFIIKDNGPGIPLDHQDHMFDRLKDIERTQDFMGTGLGLPIVKKLIEEEGEAITVLSEIGKGTTITFNLMYKVDKIIAAKNTPDTQQSVYSFKNNSILAVDDNKINQLVTKKFIEKYQAKVTTVGSGKDAIEAVKKEKFDLILMDINMPEMNGFEATTAIRAFNKDIPIIALTAVEKEKVVGDHSFNLMNGIIIKPYTSEKFLSTIVGYLK